jgi:hypothetical protein
MLFSSAYNYLRGKLPVDIMELDDHQICPLKCGFSCLRGRLGSKQLLRELGLVSGTLGIMDAEILVHYSWDVKLLLLKLSRNIYLTLQGLQLDHK